MKTNDTNTLHLRLAREKDAAQIAKTLFYAMEKYPPCGFYYAMTEPSKRPQNIKPRPIGENEIHRASLLQEQTVIELRDIKNMNEEHRQIFVAQKGKRGKVLGCMKTHIERPFGYMPIAKHDLCVTNLIIDEIFAYTVEEKAGTFMLDMIKKTSRQIGLAAIKINIPGSAHEFFTKQGFQRQSDKWSPYDNPMIYKLI